MSDVCPSAICRHDGCGTLIRNPHGHSFCRAHAACAVRTDEGFYWCRHDCAVCCSLWEKGTDDRDPQVRGPVLDSLRNWVGGFSKNWKGPYLDSEISRVILFPRAWPSSVVGYVAPPREEDLPQAEEEQLLREPLPSFDHIIPMEQESASQAEAAPLAAGASTEASLASLLPTGPSQHSVLGAVFAQLDQFKSMLGELTGIVKGTNPSTSFASSDMPSRADCPPSTADNPWRQVIGFICDGRLHLSDTQSFKLEMIEFFPNREAFPNCFYRFIPGQLSDRIPVETVILPQAETAAILGKHARTREFKQLDSGLMGGSELVFVPPKTMKTPFFVKALKAVLKSYKENESAAFTGLKEYKPTTLYAFESLEPVPEAEGMVHVFRDAKLKSDCASFQLRDSFGKIPSNLLTEEHKARTRLARSMTLQLHAESQLELDPANKNLAVTAKLNSATFGEHLSAFIQAKRKCRSAVLGKAGIKHETRMLIESTVFCRSLFPEDKVKEVLDLARRDNMSLLKRWQMPANLADDSHSSSGSFPLKRKYQGKFQPAKRRHSYQHRALDNIQSPATNLTFEAKGKAASSYSGKKGDSKTTQRPNSTSKGGKPFRGKPSKRSAQ